MNTKELLSVIGQLYVDIISIQTYAENLKNRVAELETQLEQLGARTQAAKNKTS